MSKKNKNLNSIYKEIFFPVPVHLIELKLNIDSLLEFCYVMKHKNENGVDKTNVGGWQSDNVVNEIHPEFVKLKTEIEKYVNLFHHDIQFKKIYNQKMGNIWININQKGHSNAFHDHPHSIFSGAFYLTKATAPITFQHPCREINSYYWQPPLIEEWNTSNSSEWRIQPEPNTLIIFPSWFWHKVQVNKEDTDRISFSFNTNIVNENNND